MSIVIASRRLRRASFSAIFTKFIFTATVALAQNSPSGGSLDEIVVTAQKRTESLQTVPLSVAVLTETELRHTGVFSTSEYAALIPNVSFNAKVGGDGRAVAENLVIRGVTGSNTTARYLDDAAIPSGIDLKIVDIARIEVLRGPQGTLYGASSMGGATKIVSNAPVLDAFAVDTATRISDTDHGAANYRAEGMINAPVIDNTFGLRLVGYYDDESGVFDRIVGTGSSPLIERRVDGERDRGVQLKGQWQVDDNLKISPLFVYQKDVADGAHLADISPDNFYQYRDFGLAEPLEDTLEHASIQVKYAPEDFALISATSYTSWKTDETEDATEFTVFAFGLTTPLPSPISKSTDTKVFQQEVRINSTANGPFGWLGGIYYTDTTTQNQYLNIAPGIGAAIGAGTDLVYSATDQESTHEFAGFGELSYRFMDTLKAIVGARWFHYSLDVNVIQDGLANGGPSANAGGESESGVDPKFALEDQITRNAMVYVSAAKGYRPGNVNDPVPESLCGVSAPTTYKSDSLWSYELGAKTSWLNQRLRVNGALFWIDWTNIQQQVLPACGFGYTANVGAARNRGAELEITALPLDSVELSVALGYTDAQITKGAPNVSAQPGDRVEQVPKLTASAATEYRWEMAGQTNGYARLGFQYAGESFTTFSQTDPERVREPYNLFNFNLGLQRSAWRGGLFVDNITNEHINFSDTTSLAAELPGRPRYATNRPRTIGVDIGYHFGP